MSIIILANTVSELAAQVVATDLTPTATSSQSNVGCIRGGPRHLKWTSDSATAARRLNYVNKIGNLAADYCVVVDAIAHDGEEQQIIASATYSSSETNLDTRTLQASDYVGIGSSDFVFPFSARLSSQEAFSVAYTATDYEKTARQIYFCDSIELGEHGAESRISYSRSSIHSAAVPFAGQYYHLWGFANVEFEGVNRAALDAFLDMPRTDPIFLYDDSGGDAIPEILWHCIILSEQISPQFDNDNLLNLTLGILRDWRR